MSDAHYILALDSSNEAIALGVGRLYEDERRVELIAQRRCPAHRASNTRLLPELDALLKSQSLSCKNIVCVVAGRGPGSFTGVRIALATAKGLACALHASAIGVSTLDAIAYGVWVTNWRGNLLVLADAMRKEIYPAEFFLDEKGVRRLSAERVIKAEKAAQDFAHFAKKPYKTTSEKACETSCTNTAEVSKALDAPTRTSPKDTYAISGDALVKYGALFEKSATILPEKLWTCTGEGLLLSFQEMWRQGACDPFDAKRHKPSLLLPVYTRLSDAEENERRKLAEITPNAEAANAAPKNDIASKKKHYPSMHATSRSFAPPDEYGISYRPLDALHVKDCATLENRLMKSDAWSPTALLDELPRKNRSWWAAFTTHTKPLTNKVQSAQGTDETEKARCDTLSLDAYTAPQNLIGYCGGMVIDDEMQVLKIAVAPEWQRHGIARRLLSRVAADARNLGANKCLLEVRVSNTSAQALYRTLGLEQIARRMRYYSDGEDAFVFSGPLENLISQTGLKVSVDALQSAQKSPLSCSAPGIEQKDTLCRPLILAIESSCDETAAAIVDGTGTLLSDCVASQIDFHARFGGVVPEIASRKHIEAIAEVADECVHQAALHLNIENLSYDDLDAFAATYAPGLVGALVVGQAFAKGAAFAAQKPFIAVNHLEGHLYANKIDKPDFGPPAVVSLVSGGNTLLVHMKNWGDYEILGATIDDAVGEAFDKVAKALGLGYPGGPAISKAAEEGNPASIAFPRALMYSGDLRFSLSGLKTAVVTYINEQREMNEKLNIADICASFQQAVVDVQIKKARMALEQTGAPCFCLGGGVAANPHLRDAYKELCADMKVELVLPPLSACADNAAMIALVALDRFRQKKFSSLSSDVYAHANLDEAY